MKAINARKGNTYKSQALLHGLHFDVKEEVESGLSDSQEKLIEERIAKLKTEKIKAR